MTAGVYGLVAGIVKLDDAGFYLVKDSAKSFTDLLKHLLGRALLAFAPLLMKTLSIVGTAAMFLVGGGILYLHLLTQEHHLEQWLATLPTIGTIIVPVTGLFFNMVLGLIAGALILALVNLYQKIVSQKA